MLVNMSI